MPSRTAAPNHPILERPAQMTAAVALLLALSACSTPKVSTPSGANRQPINSEAAIEALQKRLRQNSSDDHEKAQLRASVDTLQRQIRDLKRFILMKAAEREINTRKGIQTNYRNDAAPYLKPTVPAPSPRVMAGQLKEEESRQARHAVRPRPRIARSGPLHNDPLPAPVGSPNQQSQIITIQPEEEVSETGRQEPVTIPPTNIAQTLARGPFGETGPTGKIRNPPELGRRLPRRSGPRFVRPPKRRTPRVMDAQVDEFHTSGRVIHATNGAFPDYESLPAFPLRPSKQTHARHP